MYRLKWISSTSFFDRWCSWRKDTLNFPVLPNGASIKPSTPSFVTTRSPTNYTSRLSRVLTGAMLPPFAVRLVPMTSNSDTMRSTLAVRTFGLYTSNALSALLSSGSAWIAFA